MDAPKPLDRIGSLLSRRSSSRLLAIAHVLELDSFVSSLLDDSTETFIHAALTSGEVRPYVETWRRLVDTVYRDAAEVGDSEALELAKELHLQREPAAAMLLGSSWSAIREQETPEPLPGRPTRILCSELVSRLTVLA